ncbi:MAG: hydrophobe/amphiphile efflux-3 (HAE3) family protein [Halobacteriales archaeon]|jgi:hydrophobe/amphiphile efflux-3 (HAE3) family protein
MSRVQRITESIIGYSKLAIAVMLVLTVLVGAGAGQVDQSSSLDQFQSDTEAADKLGYIEENFSTGPDNRTTVQLIVRGENVLDKESLVSILRLERAYRNDRSINRTLVENRSIVGVPNLVARAAIRGEQARELQRTAAEFERLNRTVQEERATLEKRGTELNATAGQLQSALNTLRADPSASVRTQFEQVQARAPVELNRTDYAIFNRSATLLRSAQNHSQAERAYRTGTRGVLADDYAQLERRSETLAEKGAQLQELGKQLRQQQTQLEAPSSPSLQAQIEQLQSMNRTRIDRTLDRVLTAGDSGGVSGLTFMPTSYEPGETSANATMLIVTQQSAGSGGEGQSGMASEGVIDAQLRMQDVAETGFGGDMEAIVFGAGMITEEIDNSMGDSLNIVGPLALIFVLLALIVAYRDLIDILLGVFGIGAVLVWTFGFMGWAGISFNQMFVAVPVLLIGLSIDYAIHIFMRHREEREGSGNGVRGSMKVALAGVGVALVWVTATTVAGFLSNLTSPIPPIQDFGIVSAFGITATLLVFGVLVPALKVEIDAFLESHGWSRKKRAFGTGGGRFSQVLAAGSTAARKAPWVVIALALLVSAGGAYGATQVDTSFNQEDFLAEDPADWTKELPEPFKPGNYTAKQHLEYVNENFLRQDTQAQILIEGDPTDPAALRAVDTAAAQAADADPTKKLAGGGTSIQSPLSVMQGVAATNESFNATFTAADTDGDRIPDRNLERVYDELFAVAGDRAASVIHRTDDGEYRAVRLVVATSGTASATEVTSAMQPIADDIDGIEGVEATATGQLILFNIIQDQLLDTVIESLLITLVSVFAILMLSYRITKGSATLGAVTLLPVVFSVSWILGTMALADIPFNVMTGMITSLTVGLGVAYSIHLSERYTLELERTGSVWEAMRRAVTGTGGALLGSAATTVGGFGVLVFAILPPLQQFGIITGMTIVYAFLASVLVLPSLLVVWTRYLGPTVDSTVSSSETTAAGVPGTEDD